MVAAVALAMMELHQDAELMVALALAVVVEVLD
jgi:hypothetical protein